MASLKGSFVRPGLVFFSLLFLAGGLHGSQTQPIKLKIIKQNNNYSCGLACLVAVLDYWDVNTSQERLLRLHPPQNGSTGYSLGRLKEIAQKYGLNAYTLFADFEFIHRQLEKGRPLIVSLEVPHNLYNLEFIRDILVYGRVFDYLTRMDTFSHYVVVCGVDGPHIQIMDPLYGLKTISRQAFQAMWDRKKNALLLVTA
ncbi:MAG: cysteine peptidase family C39 domain-containing protein [Desulfovermiculus sp.]